MRRNVGIERSGERLNETREIIAFWSRYVMDKTFNPATLAAGAIAGWELQNMLTVCHLIATAALARTESRGAHFRLDHPERGQARSFHARKIRPFVTRP
jgi:L-aspartate oxidase